MYFKRYSFLYVAFSESFTRSTIWFINIIGPCRIDVMLHCHPVVGSLAVMMSGLCAGNDLGTGYVGTSTLNSHRPTTLLTCFVFHI